MTREKGASQNVNLLLQRGLDVQTEHSLVQAEIPNGLKCIDFRGDDDCVCQSGLLRLYYTVSSLECLYLFSFELACLQLQLSPGDKVKGPRVMLYSVVCLLK